MNYIINEDETEINIKDLLTYLFLHWRKLLAVMLIVGIGLGGVMGAMKGIKTSKLAAAYQTYLNDPDALVAKQSNTNYAQKNGIELPESEMLTDEEQQILEEVATLDSINNMNDIIYTSRRDLMAMTDYYNDSILMNVVPQYVPTAEADIMITVSEGAPANAVNVLLSAYVDYLKNGNYLDEYAEENGIDVKYLKEAITVSDITFGNIDSGNGSTTASGSGANTNVSTDVDVNFSLSTDVEGSRVGLIVIKTVGTSAESALDLLQYIVDEVEVYREATSETVNPHETTTVNYFFNMVKDDRIQVLQTETSEQLVDLQENLEIYIKSLKNLQKQHGDLIVNTMHKLPNVPLETAKTGVKFGSVGLFAAFLFYALILIIKYIVSTIALTKSQLVNRFTLFDLGSVRDGQEELYKHHSRLDKWLRRKGRLGEGNSDAGAAAAANLAVYGSDIKSILVIGKGETVKGLKDKIKDRKVYNADSLIDDPLARKLLLEVDGVVLEVRYGESKFEDIREELKLIMLAGKPVAGYIAD
ncbi:MAG: hypothetical protein IJ757_01910 [Clostridiales bacterium]|nr:hypothetical protein [Clostridiales bacterium]